MLVRKCRREHVEHVPASYSHQYTPNQKFTHTPFLYPLGCEMFILKSKLPSCVPTAPPALLNTHKTVIIHPLHTHTHIHREGEEERNSYGGRMRFIHTGWRRVWMEIDTGWVDSRPIKFRNQVSLWDQFKKTNKTKQMWCNFEELLALLEIQLHPRVSTLNDNPAQVI